MQYNNYRGLLSICIDNCNDESRNAKIDEYLLANKFIIDKGTETDESIALRKQIDIVRNYLTESIEQLEQRYFKSGRTIHAKEVVAHNILKVNTSTHTAAGMVRSEIGKQFDDNSIEIATAKVPVSEWITLSNKFYTTVFKKSNTGRMLAIDGSTLRIDLKLKTLNGIPLCSNQTKTYNYAYLSVLYDIESQTPVSFDVSAKNQEREAYERLIKHIGPNDLVLFDGGYFSNDIFKKTANIGCKYLFRVNGNEVTYKKHDPNARMVKVTALKEGYIDLYFITNMPALMNSNAIHKLYDSRWDIEVYYGFFKSHWLGDCYFKRKDTALITNIAFQILFSQIIGFFRKCVLDESFDIYKKSKVSQPYQQVYNKETKQLIAQSLLDEHITPKTYDKGYKFSIGYATNYVAEFVCCMLFGKGFGSYRLLHTIGMECVCKFEDGRHFARRSLTYNRWYGVKDLTAVEQKYKKAEVRKANKQNSISKQTVATCNSQLTKIKIKLLPKF
jgi:hypothetical protein